MATKGATRQTQTKKPWGRVVEEADPRHRVRKTVAYAFSGGRRFFHKRNPYA